MKVGIYMADLTGHTLRNYSLKRLIGRGGMASIYLAEDSKLRREVAIKVLELIQTPSDLSDFLKEAQIIASLAHPHIVEVLDYDEYQGRPYLVMKYYPGGSLRAMHPKKSILSLQTVLEYVRQISTALEYAHNQRIVHRDLKPENLLLSATNKLLLSDFGISVVLSSTSPQGTQQVAGTSQYMAPEQFNGKSSAASDQYALAVTVYEWLCGEPPFTKGNFLQLGYQHNHETPANLKERGAIISEEVEKVVMKGLAKDPSERYGNIQQFAEALEKAANKLEGFRLRRTLKGKGSVFSIAISPDGQKIASGGYSGRVYETIEIWDVRTGERLDNFKESLEFSRSLFSLAGLPVNTMTEHTQPIRAIAISPDGKFLVSGSEDKTVKIWGLLTGQLFATLKELSSSVYCVAIAPNGRTFASAGSADDTINIWNMETRELLYTLRSGSGG